MYGAILGDIVGSPYELSLIHIFMPVHARGGLTLTFSRSTLDTIQYLSLIHIYRTGQEPQSAAAARRGGQARQ